jgi:hypothetical protein
MVWVIKMRPTSAEDREKIIKHENNGESEKTLSNDQ